MNQQTLGAYNEGYKARIDGKGFDANPYSQELMAWLFWANGWRDANYAALATMTQEPTIDGD